MTEVNQEHGKKIYRAVAKITYTEQPTTIDVEFSIVENGTLKEQESNEQLKIGLTKV